MVSCQLSVVGCQLHHLFEGRSLKKTKRLKGVVKSAFENLKPLIDELAPRLNAYLKSIGTVKAQSESAEPEE